MGRGPLKGGWSRPKVKTTRPKQRRGLWHYKTAGAYNYAGCMGDSAGITPGTVKLWVPPRQSRGNSHLSKYPPAEPEALWVAAPSKGADRDPKSKPPDPSSVVDCGITKLRARTTTQAAWATVQGSLPELSNFGCLPGRAGGTPISLDGI